MKRKFNRIEQKKRLLIFILFSLTFFLFLHFQFRPIVKNICLSKARIVSTDAINEAVLEEISSSKGIYNEIVRMEKRENGELIGLLSDMEKVNKLKSKVGISIQNKFSSLKESKIKIPLGTLTGIEMLNGLGPGVPLSLSLTGSVSTEFKSQFRDAGINQTIYQIYLYVHTRIGVMVPGCSCAEDFSTNVLISETVILGGVPRVYSTNGNLGLNTGN